MARHAARVRCAQLAQAEGFRILYAEPVVLQLASTAAGAQKPDATRRLRFGAYGRAFDAALESNERLLSRLPQQRKAELATTQAYRGVLDTAIERIDEARLEISLPNARLLSSNIDGG